MLEKTIIQAEKAPKAIGPYSQAVVAKDFVFCSGQIPVDPNTGELVEADIKTQTNCVIQNIIHVLEEVGLSLQNVVKATVFLSDMNHFAGMNEVYASHFSAPFPARSTIQVARLPKDALVEIEVIAQRS